ncbi:hypothetical protein NBO_64g0018 [Nosema bombycis CQ1]|uniref:Uncharacterized protein n=1 Tax=Nosema bombycis (strain CQ1 / CVCC 102059) TaxID=578461 RepID=R0KTS1_NOSB1|nr:hypothetical protein NBO_64g0018 [Nosema bombycis CQ1]|eukprot:EOB13637.1 hypothetical protein NBO_64g0018 [Nosema bombycis CQ1]
MFLKIKNINNNLRIEDIVRLFTFDTPIYRFKEDNNTIMIMYDRLSHIGICLELNGASLIDPLEIELIEILEPVVIKNRRKKEGRCVCFISNNKISIDELEALTSSIIFYVYKFIGGKHFFIVEFEKDFNISKFTSFYDIFLFDEYLEALIGSGKV